MRWCVQLNLTKMVFLKSLISNCVRTAVTKPASLSNRVRTAVTISSFLIFSILYLSPHCGNKCRRSISLIKLYHPVQPTTVETFKFRIIFLIKAASSSTVLSPQIALAILALTYPPTFQYSFASSVFNSFNRR